MFHKTPLFLFLFLFSFFFFNDPATTEIYTLSLHDALPIWKNAEDVPWEEIIRDPDAQPDGPSSEPANPMFGSRSEEHTSELQSHSELVCRLLLEKKKTLTIAVDIKSDNELQNTCTSPDPHIESI